MVVHGTTTARDGQKPWVLAAELPTINDGLGETEILPALN